MQGSDDNIETMAVQIVIARSHEHTIRKKERITCRDCVDPRLDRDEVAGSFRCDDIRYSQYCSWKQQETDAAKELVSSA